jgi:hypothetical protein
MSNAAVLAVEESLLNLFKYMMNFLPAKYCTHTQVEILPSFNMIVIVPQELSFP